MMQQLAHLVGKNLSMGIDAETASVSELTPQQLVLAATSALNRGIEVRRALRAFKKMVCTQPSWIPSPILSPDPARMLL